MVFLMPLSARTVESSIFSAQFRWTFLSVDSLAVLRWPDVAMVGCFSSFERTILLVAIELRPLLVWFSRSIWIPIDQHEWAEDVSHRTIVHIRYKWLVRDLLDTSHKTSSQPPILPSFKLVNVKEMLDNNVVDGHVRRATDKMRLVGVGKSLLTASRFSPCH